MLDKKFQTAKPFPHLILENFLNDDDYQNLFDFTTKIENWRDIHKGEHISNRLVADYSEINGPLKNLIERLYGEKFCNFLSDLLGVKVFGDIENLRGGGLQRATNGAKFDIHLDNCWNPILNAWTVANCIFYINSEWKEEYNGCLELWDENKCVKTIEPIGNTMVITINNEKSFHGYPKPICAPPDKFRQALILFYYSHTPVCDINKREGALWA